MHYLDSKDRLLDFQDINEAITNTSMEDPMQGCRKRKNKGEMEITCRKYNPKTGDFTSAQNTYTKTQHGIETGRPRNFLRKELNVYLLGRTNAHN